MTFEWDALKELCPKCKSTELTQKHSGWGWLLLGVLLEMVLSLPRDSVVCNSCGHRWKIGAYKSNR